MPKKLILFTLQTFSTTGGIQKMTRTLGHALHRLSLKNNWLFEFWSAYDQPDDLMDQYIPKETFRGFGKNRLRFVMKAVSRSLQPQMVVLSHINLAVVGLLIKFINPRCSVWLIAHGIEVWRPLSFFKRSLLKSCDKIICVSNYTKDQMIRRHHVPPGLCHVLNNAIDPFMKPPEIFEKPQALIDRYALRQSHPILFTLTRLASTEQYKGYEQVISQITHLKEKYPAVKYILSGKWDKAEGARIKKLIAANGIGDQVIMTGFIDERELTDHFLLADLFVLPSKKEGFGIVFIEALTCGLPVICGNADGSVDAIRNGELGLAINPDDPEQLRNAIIENLDNALTTDKRRYLQAQCIRHFNEHNYMQKLQSLLTE
ncbi:glycosyltransferase family 4 protein [Mucilaginibacter angelicae]|uniref:Glycosyltransferase family 4 protein n=1 Tax=Mucilaginibacter angelicae TaxID=869718 RepID=A0ABV6L531_9SPHI